MDIKSILVDANPNIVIFLLTTFVAFMSWMLKGLVEKPLIESKNTFNKFFDKRVEILTEIKTLLKFISYFPVGDDSLEYKNKLQKVLQRDGKSAYLSKEIYDNVVKISVVLDTEEPLLLSTIKKIDEELFQNISKVQDEVQFYRKFSNFNPTRRFIGYTFLLLQYTVSLFLVVSVLLLMILAFVSGVIWLKIGILLLGIIVVWIVDFWLKK